MRYDGARDELAAAVVEIWERHYDPVDEAGDPCGSDALAGALSVGFHEGLDLARTDVVAEREKRKLARELANKRLSVDASRLVAELDAGETPARKLLDPGTPRGVRSLVEEGKNPIAEDLRRRGLGLLAGIDDPGVAGFYRAALTREGVEPGSVGCYICGQPDDTVCDSCAQPICWGCQAEGSTDCVECEA